MNAPAARRSPYPEFFIVGAPRCGTTFLHEALSAHPGIFMPARKEPHYFSNDLGSTRRGDRDFFIWSEAAYLGLFRDAGPDQLRGEADVFNLFSPSAAGRIREARPDARIVISLRDPVEQLRSFHGVRHRAGREPLSLEAALAAAPERVAGRRLPWLAMNVAMYDYRAVARFSEQVERYVAAFSRDQLLIVLLDDIATDPAAVYRRILEHVGADPEVRLPSIGVVNPTRTIRSRRLLTGLRSQPLVYGAKRVVPRRLHPTAGRLVNRLVELNQAEGGGWGDPALRAQLRAEYAPEVERLGKLTGRDLAALWGYDDA